MIKALIAFALLCAPALGQCPGGVCPRPTSPQKPFTFRADNPNAPPWATAVRITATAADGAREIGSGTVIKGTPTGALALTAAHVIRSGEPLTVEIFGQRMDRSNGSVGPAIASFAATAVDRDDAFDVGLVRFDPGRELPASPLVAPGWTPSPSEPLCAVGCSKGNDPTAVALRFDRLAKLGTDYGTWHGYKCPWPPPEGRSGGGLFTQSGELCGVCDMQIPSDKAGLYARAESLHAILAKVGIQAGEDRQRKTPRPTPMNADPPKGSTPFGSLEGEASKAASLLLPIAAGLGVGVPTTLAGVISLLMSRRKKKAVDLAPPDEPRIPTLEQLLPVVLSAYEAEELRKTQADELAEKAKEEAERKAELYRDINALCKKALAPK